MTNIAEELLIDIYRKNLTKGIQLTYSRNHDEKVAQVDALQELEENQYINIMASALGFSVFDLTDLGKAYAETL